MAELIIYSSFYSYTAQKIVEKIAEIPEDEKSTFRINSQGGETSAGFSILSRMSEMKIRPDAIVDGNAMSMAAFILPFFDKVIVNSTSEIMFHKAAYNGWYKPTATEEAQLKVLNDKFKTMLEKKVAGRVGGAEFIAEVFEADVRNDVYVTAERALSLGIASEIRTIEPTAHMSAEGDIIALENVTIKAKEEVKQVNNNKKKDTMTQEDVDKAVSLAVAQETERVSAWLVFLDVDKEAVKAGIEDPKAKVTAKVQSEMMMKMASNAKLGAHKDDNAESQTVDPTADEGEKTEAEKNVDSFMSNVNKNLGITKED